MADLDAPGAIVDLKLGQRVLGQQIALQERLGASEAALGNVDKAAEYADRARALRVCVEALQELIDG